MNWKKEFLTLYAVTDRRWEGEQSLAQQVEEAILGGVTMVQYRNKEDGRIREDGAVEIQKICRKYGVPFLIDDDVELAVSLQADGVHLGQDDMDPAKARALLGEDKIIGVTAKTIAQVRAAEAAGADYLGSGAVFGTSTKEGAIPMSLVRLKEITAASSLPVVAIGGIDASNIRRLAHTGIAGVAVVSGIFAEKDTRAASQKLRELAPSYSREFETMPTALTIAGSDSSGGAGIQADLKTMTAHRVYGMSAITALTAQNTTGVSGIMEVTPEFLEQQLDMIFQDIYPDAIKTGMVASADLIRMIGRKLRQYRARNIVVDPVMVATSGARLISEDAIDVLKEELLPLATVLTPNIPEAEVLSGMEIHSAEDMEKAAQKIAETYGCGVLCKGGHQLNDANDLLYYQGTSRWFYGERIDNPNTHGTGCTLSSAIASNLAKGETLEKAVLHAKKYLSNALAARLDLGEGAGPLHHAYAVEGEHMFFGYEFRPCDGLSPDFVAMCELLDEDLERRVGKVIQRSKYAAYNHTDHIRQAMVVYYKGKPVAGGAIRPYDDDAVELKRMFVKPELQGMGIGAEIVSRLESWARELGYKEVLLETGELLVEACALYRKLGYEVIPNYGPYVDMKESLCMRKIL